MEGAQSPNLRPYQCPHHQKYEVEGLVKKTSQVGIIYPNISPILLVQKNDGGWHFYVDYWALNKLTISNKFPIPTIDVLLDELGNVTIFSKLDLKFKYHK